MNIDLTQQISKRFVLIENKFINTQYIKYVEIDSGWIVGRVSVVIHFTSGDETLYFSGENAQQLIDFLSNESQAIIGNNCLLSDREILMSSESNEVLTLQ
jgi:hypothetical protein